MVEHPHAPPDFASPDDQSSHYAEVGLVASSWSLFEVILDSASLKLAQFDSHIGFCFTAQISGSGRKIDAYISVAKCRGAKSTIPDLERFAKDTASLAERRNRAVHDPWYFHSSGSPGRFEITARRQLRIEYINVPTATVHKLAGDILAHMERFCDLDDRITAELPS
jgi:hypothetical protein